MNTNTIKAITMIVVTLALSACDRNLAKSAPATPKREIVVLLGRIEEKEHREMAFKGIMSLLLEVIRPGDSLVVKNGYSFEEVAAFRLPDSPAYANQKLRLRESAMAINDLKRLLIEQEGLEVPVFRVPQFLREVSQMSHSKERSLGVIILGSEGLLYSDPKEPDFSMQERFPSDGHLFLGEDKSPFSATGAGDLSGSWIVWSDLEQTEFVNEVHEISAKRFWRLFARRLGFESVSFTREFVPAARSFLDGGATATGSDEQPDEKDPPRMIVPEARKADLSWLVNPVEQAKPAVLPTATPTRIGITWENPEQTDLDLYVKSPGSPELFYRNPETDEGRLIKDYGSGGNRPLNGFEAAELEGHVDPKALEIWVNLYRFVDAEGPIRCEIRILYQGQLVSEKIEFARGPGDRGADSAARAHSQFWQRINLQKLVGPKKLTEH